MRIISGEKRGTKLLTLEGDSIRPTSDKIKGAVFNSIQFDLIDSKIFADLFGGSGAIGIEALSRGVPQVYFFDKEKNSISVINKNLDKTGFTDRACVKNMSAESGISFLYDQKIKCDFIYMDPPYEKGSEMLVLLKKISDKEILNNKGIIMLEHKKNVIMPINIGKFVKTKDKLYGITRISFYSWEKNS